MRRILSLLLLTLWLLMNGNASYAFSKSNESGSSMKASMQAKIENLKLSFFTQGVSNEDDRIVYYEEEDEEDEDEILHQAARLHAVILYQLLFLFDGCSLQADNSLTQVVLPFSETPVYLACQNFRI